MLKQQSNYKKLVWKKINMRNVDHLLGAEFIHNLYNRHLSRINSIRFRHTKVTWKNGQVNSYAPLDEWQYLRTCFGQKFLRQDKFLLSEMENLLNFDRNFLNNFIKHLKNFDYKKASNEKLVLLLIDVQNYILGELYSVNLVQIEQALTYALDKLLQKYEKDENTRLKIISQIITTQDLSESQKEELAFAKIIKLGRKENIANPKKSKNISKQIIKHHNKYTYMHCAYGELPYELEHYYKKYKLLYNKDLTSPAKLNNKIEELLENKKNILSKIKNPKVKKLAEIMSRVGVFRDYNKAMLGQTVKYRLKILDEIARRKLDSRHNLNFYLLSDVNALLRKNKRLSQKNINNRANNGITLTRNEDLQESMLSEGSIYKGEKKLKGICASPGKVKSVCKIVLTKKDIDKINDGDIMVAIGTDFDLMDAIQRSAAVITEEGGLLSHASVVCREIKKPCCIGVENATTVLKDGYKITLDASKGLIKIHP